MTGSSYKSLNDISEEEVKKIQQEAWEPDVITCDVLEALYHGDHEAFREVYLHWRKPIYGLLLKLTGSDEDAEDITQDVFIKVWENHSKVDPSKNIKSLLYLIARHMAINHFEKRKVRENYATSIDNTDVNFENSYDIIVEKETRLLMQVALDRMPRQRKTIYQMSYEEGLDAGQIAEKLAISKASVYNQLSAARKDLKELLTLFMVLFV